MASSNIGGLVSNRGFYMQNNPNDIQLTFVQKKSQSYLVYDSFLTMSTTLTLITAGLHGNCQVGSSRKKKVGQATAISARLAHE